MNPWEQLVDQKYKPTESAEDVLQIMQALDQEQDSTRILRLESRLNAKWKQLAKEDVEHILKVTGQEGTLKHLKLFNGKIIDWKVKR